MLLKELTEEEENLVNEMIDYMFYILTENEKYEKQIFLLYKKAFIDSTLKEKEKIERFRGDLLKFVNLKFTEIFKNYGNQILLNDNLSPIVFNLFSKHDSWFYMNYGCYSVDYINKNFNYILADFAKQNFIEIIWEVIDTLVDYCKEFTNEE